jgi:hypothetical protein
MIDFTQPIDWGDLKNKSFIKPDYIIDPIVTNKSLCMIHSWRGVGKTFFSLGLSQAIASNSPFLKWLVHSARVFYFDCEMGECDVQARYQLLDSNAPYKTHDSSFRLFTFEHMGGRTWNLACLEYQKEIAPLIADYDFIVIDNLSAACRPVGRETFQQAFWRFRDWIISLKDSNKAVLIVHHSGKEGRQRGISDIEDPLDLVIHLRRSENYTPTMGSVYELHFEKNRGIAPIDSTVLEPIEITLKSYDEDRTEWLWRPLWEKQREDLERKKRSYKDDGDLQF